MSQRKNFAHRPSQANQRFVRRQDGTQVINTAYKQDGFSTVRSPKDIKSDFSGETTSDGATVVPMNIPLSEAALEVSHMLSDAGKTPYVVGGKVRDHLLGKPNKDVDIEVYGVSSVDELVDDLRSMGCTVNIAGQSFGVIKCTLDDEEMDISLPRKDSLQDTMNKHTSIQVDIDPDLTPREASTRRDFTINALMYDPVQDVVIDHHGGLEDMKNRSLRIVDPSTFTDDPLRVLRGVQFAARFDYDMDTETVQLARTMTWEGLAKERIAGEIHKMLLKSTNLHKGIETLRDTGWIKAVPGLVNNFDTPLNQKIVDTVTSLDDKDLSLGLITRLMDSHYGSSEGKLSQSFMLTNKQRRMFNKLPVHLAEDTVTASKMRRYLHSCSVDQKLLEECAESLGVQAAPSVWKHGAPPRYTVTGDTLLGLGVSPSPAYKRILEESADIEDRGEVVTPAKLQEIIKRNT